MCRDETGEPELLRFRAALDDCGESAATVWFGIGVATREGAGDVDGNGTLAATGATAAGCSAATGGGSDTVGSGTSSTDSMMTSSPGAVSVVVLMLTPPRLGSGLGGARSGVGTSSRSSAAVPSMLVGREGSRDAPRRRAAIAPPSYSS